jgi:hypothetical protein
MSPTDLSRNESSWTDVSRPWTTYRRGGVGFHNSHPQKLGFPVCPAATGVSPGALQLLRVSPGARRQPGVSLGAWRLPGVSPDAQRLSGVSLGAPLLAGVSQGARWLLRISQNAMRLSEVQTRPDLSQINVRPPQRPNPKFLTGVKGRRWHRV